MKIIKPSVEFFGELQTDYASTMKFIEMAGRTCYKSEDKITEDSAEGFVSRLIKAGHLAMVEHSNFVVKIDRPSKGATGAIIGQTGKYLSWAIVGDTAYVGGNLTAWANTHRELVEKWGANLADDSMFMPFFVMYGKLFGVEVVDAECPWQVCPHNEIPHELHRYAAKFICDRGVSHELVRHRPCSFAQESTRYVNYGGTDMEFIEPTGFMEWGEEARDEFLDACYSAEISYGLMVNGYELKPQQARAVLPNALKTEIVVTADAKEWAHIRKLRTHKSAHPDIVRVMGMMPWEMIEE